MIFQRDWTTKEGALYAPEQKQGGRGKQQLWKRVEKDRETFEKKQGFLCPYSLDSKDLRAVTLGTPLGAPFGKIFEVSKDF